MEKRIFILSISIILLTFLSSNVIAQNTKQLKNTSSYFTIKTELSEKVDMLSEKERKQFNRWNNYWETRVDKTGSFTRSSTEMYNYLQSTSEEPNFKSISASGVDDFWECIGPFLPIAGTNSAKGIGRVESVWVDPDNHNVIYIGGDSGGLWRSTDKGVTYNCLTDDISGIGVYDIEVVKGAGTGGLDVIYIATGIWGNGSIHSGGYSVGILKSIDGGNSFNTSMGNSPGNELFMRELVVDPQNSNVLYAISTSNIYRSTNAGFTWEDITRGIHNDGDRFLDIFLHPSDPDIIYISGDNNLIRTDNARATNVAWRDLTPNYVDLPSSYTMAIAVSPLEPNSLFTLCEDATRGYQTYSYQKSTDLGNSWTELNAPRLDYGGPCVGIAVAPDDADKIYLLDKELFSSSGTGQNISFSSQTSGAVHDDMREVIIFSNSLGTYDIFLANDGGLSFSNDGGSTWSDISGNLAINQFYDIDITQTDPVKIVGGTHDCGSYKYESGIWEVVFGGDGGASLFSQTDSDTAIISWNKILRITNDDFSTSPSGFSAREMYQYDSPVIQHPHKSNVYYISDWEEKSGKASSRIFMTNDGGANWDDGLFNGYGIWSNIQCMEINESNPNYFYYSGFSGTSGHIQGTKDNGATWSNIANNLGTLVSDAKITEIISHPYDPGQVWVAFGNFEKGKKVYQSVNAGDSWTNISAGLVDVNFPVQTLAYDKVNNCLYAGTDVGVFYRSNVYGAVWAKYGTNMPNVIVSDIEINYKTNQLIVATYGRGIWRAPLYCPVPVGHRNKKGTLTSQNVFANTISVQDSDVPNARYVDFRVLENIHIQSDFHVAKGGIFHGYVNECNSSILNSTYKNTYATSGVLKNAANSSVDISTGTKTKIYPNPVENMVDVILPDQAEIVHIYVYDVQGRTLLSTKKHSSNFSVDLSNLNSGIYLMKINADGVIEDHTIIKK